MIIAKEKKTSNIAEYLIYMFQVEDLLRAVKFELSAIEKIVINQFKVSDDEKIEIRNWYAGLIEMMKEEKIEQKGHLQFIINTINDLNELHLRLLNSGTDQKYNQVYQIAKPNIQEFQNRSKSETRNDIEICINGLYSLLLLRLQKKEITKETLASFNTFSEFLAYFSLLYKKYENGELEI